MKRSRAVVIPRAQELCLTPNSREDILSSLENLDFPSKVGNFINSFKKIS